MSGDVAGLPARDRILLYVTGFVRAVGIGMTGVLLGLYANGPVGNLIDQPVASRVEHVLTHVSKVHPQVRTEFESAYAVWWKKVKYNEGGYASGRNPERRARLSKLDHRIVVGSAAVTPHSEPDWQEGAISAGWQTLKTIHERAMRG